METCKASSLLSYIGTRILVIFTLATLIVSCDSTGKDDPEQDEDTITIASSSQSIFSSGISLDYKGLAAPAVISFKAAESWRISASETKASPSWLHINPTSGQAGNATVEITVDVNPEAKSRSATVTVSCGSAAKSFTVTVEGLTNKVPVEKIRVDGAPALHEMLVGETVQLSARVAPDEASLPWVSWSSSNSTVATVVDGLVTAKDLGTTTISASADGVSSEIEVRVVSSKSDSGVKASYSDFIGRWTVTGTEHKWFNRTNTYSYDIQIEADVEGQSYLIYNWETAATASDAANLYYGSTDSRSIFQALTEALKGAGVSPVVKARFDADKGQLQIDRQTFYTNTAGVPYTIEFLGDVVDTNGHTSEGSWLTTPGDSDRQYTICDFVKQADGSVNICSHRGSGIYQNIAFMGYAQFKGYPESMHYNKKFAFPYKMVKNPTEYKVTSVSISETSISLLKGETKSLTATALPETAFDRTIKWSTYDYDVASVSQEGIVTAKAAGTTTIRASVSNGLYADCTVTVTEPGPVTENGHEFVDLGLPSGIMWATCNIGAENNDPTNLGTLFAWGETSPKAKYNKDTYAYYTLVKQGDDMVRKITKYCTDGTNGTVDGKTRLVLSDDAAHVSWGGRWRIPTKAEWQELLDKTMRGGSTFSKTFTNRTTGASISIPMGGFWTDDHLTNANAHYYWSSDVFSENCWNAYALRILMNAGTVDLYNEDREWGLPIRAVFDPKE